MAHTVYCPTKLIFSDNAAADLERELASFGPGPAMVVTDAGILSSGILDRLMPALAAGGRSVEVFSDVPGNPGVATVAAALAKARAIGAERAGRSRRRLGHRRGQGGQRPAAPRRRKLGGSPGRPGKAERLTRAYDRRADDRGHRQRGLPRGRYRRDRWLQEGRGARVPLPIGCHRGRELSPLLAAEVDRRHRDGRPRPRHRSVSGPPRQPEHGSAGGWSDAGDR